MADGEFAQERPLIATLVLTVVGTVAYVGVSVAFGNGASLPAAVVFAVVFTLVYMTFVRIRAFVGWK